MPIELDVQYATDLPGLPNEDQLKLWVETALEGLQENVVLTIRIVDEILGFSRR